MNLCPSACYASRDEPRNVIDSKNICRWSVMRQEPQGGGKEIYRFDQVGNLAANILARAGVFARVDPDTGRVIFDGKEATTERVAAAA